MGLHGGGGFLNFGQRVAIQFSSFSGQPEDFYAVTLALSLDSGVNNLKVALYDDNGGIPRTELETLVLDPAVTATPTAMRFVSSTNTVLADGSNYYIVLEQSNTNLLDGTDNAVLSFYAANVGATPTNWFADNYDEFRPDWFNSWETDFSDDPASSSSC